MVDIILVFTSLFLIGIIFLRIPQETVGLASFTAKTNLLGSPSSADRFLNILTVFGIIIYFGIAFELNFLNV